MTLFLENVRLALSSLKANKMRALLTMLGIIIGISSVIAIMTVGNSISSSVSSELGNMGAANINVYITRKNPQKDDTEEGLDFGETSVSMNITDDDMITKEMIQTLAEEYPDDIYAIGINNSVGSGQVKMGPLYANVSVSGASLGSFIADDIKLLEGRYFTEREFQDGQQVGIVSDKFVNNLFGGDQTKAIGSIVNVSLGEKEYQFTVVGVYEYVSNNFMFSMTPEKDIETSFYIPVQTSIDMRHREGFSYFTIMAKSGVDTNAFAGKVQRFFESYYHSNRSVTVEAMSMASMVETMTSILDKITMAISLIAAIALLVGGIGVMNIMLVSITERTREIGTRKALGAPNSSIRLQFIVEAVVICLIGGAIGVSLGISGGILLTKLMKYPATPSLSSVIGSLLFSMAIGVFFGYYPANKAAKMDPIEALRYE